MDTHLLWTAQEALHAEIYARGECSPAERGAIADGVADIGGYATAPVRIAWILKEAYCDRGGWDHCAMLAEMTGPRAASCLT